MRFLTPIREIRRNQLAANRVDSIWFSRSCLVEPLHDPALLVRRRFLGGSRNPIRRNCLYLTANNYAITERIYEADR